MNQRAASNLTAALLFAAPVQLLADPTTSFEGSVSATLSRNGAPPTNTLLTRKGNQIRIEDVDKSKSEPSNLIDLEVKKLTIIYPHNSSFVRLDLTKARAAPSALPPDMPALPRAAAHPPISPPPGFPSRPPMPANPAGAGLPANSSTAGIPAGPCRPCPACSDQAETWR